jgi:putative transcriptional regulator
MNENIILKNRLKVARAENNLSQEQLAALVGVTRQTISSIETGQYCPTAKLALLISKVFNKKFEDLFYFEEVNEDVIEKGRER